MSKPARERPSRPPLKSAIVLAKGGRDPIRRKTAELIPQIQRFVDVVHVDFDFGTDLDSLEADFVIVIGGDGSILRAARQMGDRQRPVVGVNVGRLGFLADVPPERLETLLTNVTQGSYSVIDHLMFRCRIERNGQPLERHLGLNEVAVLAGPPFSLLDVQLYVDGELATTYSCDGLIISTPVGSTAHNLSAGGPILRKNLQAFVISPISPHTLTNRPVVDSAERTYELVVPNPNEGTSLVVDGQLVGQLTAADRVGIQRASSIFQVIAIEGQGYYRTLREKLGWGGQLNRHPPP